MEILKYRWRRCPYLQKKMKAITSQVPSVNTLIIPDSTQLPYAVVCMCMFVSFTGGGEGFKHQSLSCWFYYLPEERELLPHCCVAWKPAAASGVKADTSCRDEFEPFFSVLQINQSQEWSWRKGTERCWKLTSTVKWRVALFFFTVWIWDTVKS